MQIQLPRPGLFSVSLVAVVADDGGGIVAVAKNLGGTGRVCHITDPLPPLSLIRIPIRDFLTTSDAASLFFFAPDYCENFCEEASSPSLSPLLPPCIISLNMCSRIRKKKKLERRYY